VTKTLTIAQLKKRHDGEWVLLDRLVTTRTGALRAGAVLAHSRDRDEVHRRMLALRPRRFALRFFGKRAKHVVYALSI